MSAYHSIKELGLKGKRSASSRLRGIDKIAARAEDASVLDLGCGEGLIAFELAKAGCRLVHGVEHRPDAVETANKLFGLVSKGDAKGVEFEFFKENIEPPADLFDRLNNRLLDQYDIVLLLGVYHKNDVESSMKYLEDIAAKCSKLLAFRGGLVLHDAVRARLSNLGFVKVAEVSPTLFHRTFGSIGSGRPSPLVLYERKQAEGG